MGPTFETALGHVRVLGVNEEAFSTRLRHLFPYFPVSLLRQTLVVCVERGGRRVVLTSVLVLMLYV